MTPGLGLAYVPPGGDLSEQADVPRQLRQPHQPTALEVQEHRVTHMPYRSCMVPYMCESQGTAYPSQE
eukprot:3976088-Amphidinium_carterae.1